MTPVLFCSIPLILYVAQISNERKTTIPICSWSCIWMLFKVALLWYIRCLCFLARTSSLARIRALPTSCGRFLAKCLNIFLALSSSSFRPAMCRSSRRSSRRMVDFHFWSYWLSFSPWEREIPVPGELDDERCLVTFPCGPQNKLSLNDIDTRKYIT